MAKCRKASAFYIDQTNYTMITRLLQTVLIFLFIPLLSIAQDTTIVQTLDFEDITKRRGWYNFPEETDGYQKILMYYTLKCDQATTQDNFACGEWDYTTYTNLYQHENVGSSRYLVNGGYPEVIDYVNNPTYTYYQTEEDYIVYDNVISETDYTVGADVTDIYDTFKAGSKNGKAQYLWLASELTDAGLTAGSIDKLKFDFFSTGELNNLSIRMKNSALTVLAIDSYEKENLETVYTADTEISTTGIYEFNLTTSFEWDGTSNVAIDFCFDNAEATADMQIKGNNTGFNSGVFASENDGKLDFDWGDYVQVPASAFDGIEEQITVSFWSHGDLDALPANTYVFEGLDAENRRVINVHLPWSNSRIYWDAGNSNTSNYDRIDEAANLSDFAGQWNHWAFTKDTSTGTMQIFLNGILWHSGTGKTRTMDGITQFRIAARGNGEGRYKGAIHEFRVWDVALDEATIQDWMYKDVNALHPAYDNLKVYYQFEEDEGFNASDLSGNDLSGDLIGLPAWAEVEGCELYRNLESTSERPRLIFTQGEYESHLESTTITESVLNAPVSIIEYSTAIDLDNPGITQVPLDTIYGWEAGYMYTYDEAGESVDSIFVDYDSQLLNDYKQETFQIQNYVTPYGIGLSLGSDGFRWVYDVTDYAPILKGQVEISAGNQQELIDLKFVMIEGTPPREIIDIQSIWLGDYQHSDIANDVVMPAVELDLHPDAISYRVKTRTSGHWFGGFQNCAEFCPKLHHLKVDDVMQFEWNNWKECADNPVIAQGGTWIYDRAGWCPGTFTDTYDHDITPFVTPGESVSLDYGMQVTPNGMEGNYRVTMQLVSYGETNFEVDAAISEIISPSDWEFRSKINPICTDPIVEIENTGSSTLTSVLITYNVLGGESMEYEWTGSLEFTEKEQVTLPIPNQGFWDTDAEEDVFEVTVWAPNGTVPEAEYEGNNYARTTFEKPEVYSGLFMFRMYTNNAGYENSYTIKNDLGETVMSRDGMSNTTIYEDTVFMEDGCYVLEFLDSGQDGMSFFANNDGNGSIRFKGLDDNWQNVFNAKFGAYVKHHFRIDNTVGIDEFAILQNVIVYPNPSKDVFNISATGLKDKEVNVEVINSLGQVILKEVKLVRNGELKSSINLSEFSNGMYHLRLYTSSGSLVKNITKQ